MRKGKRGGMGMNILQNCYPRFAKNRILKKEMLEALRDHCGRADTAMRYRDVLQRAFQYSDVHGRLLVTAEQMKEEIHYSII